ncbi:hypothetical protein LVB77_01315 [Lysobacter sp. 5GHs7-4]|uniref:hypothetical protein n=1 Tax=Lysobacter sp. 5GHs7-4 TaxID=2904253 RepID=UPI001E365ECC|nr:hypothetical protein [Lysobacter sp. 5GHs7-4]UHQ23383.1 hypothetical protein LVB77_01315 [Lysobacter sp. 5GHs7-4]
MLILAPALSGGAIAAEAASDAARALRELAIADGVQLSRASYCGYSREDLDRLLTRLHERTIARAQATGASVDDKAYKDGMYVGMQQAMDEVLRLPPQDIADEHVYRAKHCGKTRAQIDALLAPVP